MRKRVVVSGPVLSQSGYGEQARFALRALRSREDLYDIFVVPLNWGQTGWVNIPNEERRWLDEKIAAAHHATQAPWVFDLSLQVGIPNEWKKLARFNIGYTAGIETTMVAPIWLEKANEMDRVIVVSNHSKEVFENTTYSGKNKTGQVVNLSCGTPIQVVNYPYRKFEKETLKLSLDYNFNYLAISQWGPRKNFDNLINWFIEENFDQEVGLVLKTSIKNNCLIDRFETEHRLKGILSKHSDCKCKVYLLHGDLSEEEMTGLYQHPKIKCLISTAHGEGYGLPLFEAAYNGMPVISHPWSGQRDFLYMPDKRRTADKKKPMFATVEYDLKNVQPSAVWDGVIQADSQWAFPREASFKRRLREVRKNYTNFKKKAKTLQKYIIANFTEEKMYSEFLESFPAHNQIEPCEFAGISFCISTNGKKVEKTKYTIKSLQSQITTKDVEIIVVGAVDDFADMKGVKLIEASDVANGGFLAELRNIGARNSSQDVICYLDDDILFPPNWLWRLEEFSRKEGWDVLGTRILNPDGSRLWDRATMKPHILVSYDHPCSDKNLYQTGGFSVHRKEVFENLEWDGTIPAFAEKHGKINEDIDYSLRLHESSYLLKFDKENTVWHWDDEYTQVKTPHGSLTLRKSDILEHAPGPVNFPPVAQEFKTLLSLLGAPRE